VQEGRGLAEVLKTSEIIHHREETGGRRSGDPRVGAPGGFPRENKDLHEVAKSGLNPDRWIWRGHVEAVHT
jgi:hypothetical protein